MVSYVLDVTAAAEAATDATRAADAAGPHPYIHSSPLHLRQLHILSFPLDHNDLCRTLGKLGGRGLANL